MDPFQLHQEFVFLSLFLALIMRLLCTNVCSNDMRIIFEKQLFIWPIESGAHAKFIEKNEEETSREKRKKQ